jgi:hypothetical protein
MGALALGALVTACLAPVRATAQGAREWTRIPGGAETGCALGTPYAFFHREGDDSRSLLVWFQGGGACWDWVSCSGLFDSDVADDELSPYAGIFDRSNPENPFRDFEIVFVPYCTGDVHVGDTTRVYGDDRRSATGTSRAFSIGWTREGFTPARWSSPGRARGRTGHSSTRPRSRGASPGLTC